MKKFLKNTPGFRKDIKWKNVAAATYYLLCIIDLILGHVSRFLIIISLPFIVLGFISLIKHRNKTVILTFIGIILIFSIGIKLGNTGSKTTTSFMTNNNIYAVNNSVKLNKTIVTVTKVVKTRSGKYESPENGMEFVIVSVSIKNIGESQISYSPSEFQMQNSIGQTTYEDIAAIINNDSALSGGNLVANETVTGTIVFMQPINDSSLVLKYNANYFKQKEIRFKLN